jgi:tRNA-dihydrouridine synthase 2
MIGTTRRYNEESRTIDWCRYPSQPTQKQDVADTKESVIFRICPEREVGKLIFQMGTSDPERAVEAARLVAADVSGIDVNAGCPKPFSTSGGMGAALLRTPDKLCAILEALVQNITPEFEIGISVKIRLLETPAETEVLVRQLCATGITALTIHCRTTPMRPRERALRGQLRMIADVCHEAGVACLMNGDVVSRDQGMQLAEEFGTDGAMIATAAEKNPSCFRSEAQGGILPWQEVVEEYIKITMSINNRWGNTKFLLSQMIPGKADAYKRVTQCKNYTQLCKALGLEHLLSEAGEVDGRLNIEGHISQAAEKSKNNAAAKAAGGETAKDRMSKSQNRKSLSERSGSTAKHVDRESVALAG